MEMVHSLTLSDRCDGNKTQSQKPVIRFKSVLKSSKNTKLSSSTDLLLFFNSTLVWSILPSSVTFNQISCYFFILNLKNIKARSIAFESTQLLTHTHDSIKTITIHLPLKSSHHAGAPWMHRPLTPEVQKRSAQHPPAASIRAHLSIPPCPSLPLTGSEDRENWEWARRYAQTWFFLWGNKCNWERCW